MIMYLKNFVVSGPNYRSEFCHVFIVHSYSIMKWKENWHEGFDLTWRQWKNKKIVLSNIDKIKMRHHSHWHHSTTILTHIFPSFFQYILWHNFKLWGTKYINWTENRHKFWTHVNALYISASIIDLMTENFTNLDKI